MIKEFNNLEEIQKYYDYKTNTYVFKEDNEYIDLIVFNFDLHINANINAFNIKAYDINVCDINACDICAYNIEARDIIYYAVCFAYKNIICASIIGLKGNSKHFVLDGKLEVKDEK